MCEPSPFSPRWHSFKHNGAELRYEVAIEVTSGHIAWAFGGYPAGACRDDDLAQLKLKRGERSIADRGCRRCWQFFAPKEGSVNNSIAQRILARGENVFRRIKSFDVMGDKFRHDLALHHMCFFAVVSIMQIAIECGDKLPEVSGLCKF